MDFKEQIILLVRTLYAEIIRFSDQLSPQERQQVGEADRWSPRDVLAHLAEEQRGLAERLAELSTAPTEQDSADYEAYNRLTWHAYRDRSMEEILGVLDAAQENLLPSLQGLNETDLKETEKYPWTDGRPLWRLIAGTGFLHPMSHLRQLYIDRGDRDEARRLSQLEADLALELDESPDWKAVVIYNRACMYALGGEKEEALKDLAHALRLAPRLIDWSKEDTDLVSLHETPEYQTLISELEARQD